MAARRLRALRRPLRVYVDTSVFGGVHDAEFREPSERFFAAVRDGAFVLEAHQGRAEVLETSDEAAALAEAYLDAGVVPPASRIDALHVALASVARADAVVSWNFKHLVQLRSIRGFHAVNVLRGYPLIEIRSPLEVTLGEET